MEKTDIKRWQRRLAAARGDREVDLLFVGGSIINVFNGTVERTSLAVFDGCIVGFGDYPAKETVDLAGRFVAPGFIEGHIHIESSKLTPARFTQAVVPHGTTTVIADPHEIANVRGIDGIRYMLDQTEDLPLDVFFMLPSCVPATTMETSGAALSAADLKQFLDDPKVLGIAELMNYPGAVSGDREVLEKVALAAGKMPVDGHAPGLTGRGLSAYLAAGPATDHECIRLDEAREKLARGMRIMIREGSTAHNLDALLPLVNPKTERRCLFVSDDRKPGDLMKRGHLDHILSRAVASGLDPITAVRMVTLNSAETFGLADRGGIGPGRRADLVVIDDLEDFRISSVWIKGVPVARYGSYLPDEQARNNALESGPLPIPEYSSRMLDVEDRGKPVKVIGLIPDQIVTVCRSALLPSRSGRLIADLREDIIKLAVIERYSGQGGHGIGFVQGIGLREGAMGSTIAHDSHNIIVCGADDESILTAVRRLKVMGGGQVVTSGEIVIAELPLPVAGLMSDRSISEVTAGEDGLITAAKKLGCHLPDPFMTLSFLALPVIPELKLTDRGLVDVNRFQLVSLYD